MLKPSMETSIDSDGVLRQSLEDEVYGASHQHHEVLTMRMSVNYTTDEYLVKCQSAPSHFHCAYLTI